MAQRPTMAVSSTLPVLGIAEGVLRAKIGKDLGAVGEIWIPAERLMASWRARRRRGAAPDSAMVVAETMSAKTGLQETT